MSTTLVPASLRISATEKRRVSPAVEAIRNMSIEQLRAEIQKRRQLSAQQRDDAQRAQTSADADAAATRLANLAG